MWQFIFTSPDRDEVIHRRAMALSQGTLNIPASVSAVAQETAAETFYRERVITLEQDAERYRWLRESARFVEIQTHTQLFRTGGQEQLDKLIDTARKPE